MLWGLVALLLLIAVLSLVLLLNLRTPSPTNLERSALLAHPPSPLRAPITVRIATMNEWGVKYQCPHRTERMPAIGRALADCHPDFVGFQEAFVQADRQALLAPLEKEGLNHHHYFRSGLVGSGLLVAGRRPFAEVFFRRYSAGGKAWRVDHGDWWAGKGVCVVRMQLPEDRGGAFLDLFVTHAHARYSDDHYDAVRSSNMRDLVVFIRQAATGTTPAFVLGDFNVRPEEPQYHTLVEGANLERLMHAKSRIDHIFAVRTPQYRFEVLDTTAIAKRIPIDGGTSRLSDHTGYVSTIRIVPVE